MTNGLRTAARILADHANHYAGGGRLLVWAELTPEERHALYGASLRGAYLAGADLRWADLIGTDLRGANLRGANLSGANLSGAYLSRAYLSRANLSGANLSRAYLSGANLSDAIGLPKAPIVTDLHKRVAVAVGDAGEGLDMSGWHCGTRHCRAGWAITLAGDAGAEFEKRLGPCAAGALIYHASTGMVPEFYGDDEAALEDIKRYAEVTP